MIDPVWTSDQGDCRVVLAPDGVVSIEFIPEAIYGVAVPDVDRLIVALMMAQTMSRSLPAPEVPCARV